jgi:dynein heavy chain, axonemal
LLFFLMNDLVKIHTYYIYSLKAFTTVFYRGIDLVTVSEKEKEMEMEKEKERERVAALETEAGEGTEPEPVQAEEQQQQGELTDEQLAARCVLLVDSITSTVFKYVRRGVFETDKLTAATLLTLRIAVNDGEYAAHTHTHIHCTHTVHVSDSRAS